jgi:hypothetical protein
MTPDHGQAFSCCVVEERSDAISPVASRVVERVSRTELTERSAVHGNAKSSARVASRLLIDKIGMMNRRYFPISLWRQERLSPKDPLNNKTSQSRAKFFPP